MKGSLARFRVMAYVTGVGLLVLTVGVILKYAADAPTLVAVVGPIHGFLYMVYLVCAFDLSLKSKWAPLYTIGVLLAGTIPFLSFVAERKVTHRVTEKLAETEATAA
jgi:integral membrane protein